MTIGSVGEVERAAGDAGEVISFFDEVDLRAFFTMGMPKAPGAETSFGAMCARLGMRNPKTAERPTPFVVHRDGTTSGAPWTELVECPPASKGSAFDPEDALVAYVDAKRRMSRVRAALALLSVRHVEVLAAHYGEERGGAAWGRPRKAAPSLCAARAAYARAREELRACR
jgi:hypothetical protein